jgi:thioredoxin 1
MVPVVAEIALEYKDKFVVAKLDIDESPQAAQKYDARRIRPTFIVFQDGEIVERFRGVTPKAEFVQKVLDAIDVEGN